jgi:hypothetical protein
MNATKVDNQLIFQGEKIINEQYRQLKTALLSDIEDIAIGDLTPWVLLLTMGSLVVMPYG